MRRPLFGLIVAISLISAACAPAAGAPTWTFQPGMMDGGMHGASQSPQPSSAAGGDVLGQLAITAVDLGFQPNQLTVDQAGRYQVTLTNTGVLTHDLTFSDGTKVSVDP